ncbi:hypothetical protein D915_004512 [Fasciola hepatica]|uniref:Uncharacterized protein n=1 Tax=Fasciola hepatica TaxID=6192 RepID=A0A4E0RZF0_FASHE|nr:hypothetical protein D915_004512 [Fasciola hepatica]
MTAAVTTDSKSTAEFTTCVEFRPRILPVTIAHSAASLWADPSTRSNGTTSNIPTNFHPKTGHERVRTLHRKRSHTRAPNRRFSMHISPVEELSTKRTRTEHDVTDGPKLYIDPKTESRDIPFSKPSPLMKLMQCCERLLSEQKPAPFRDVLPDRYIEEVIGPSVTIPSPSYLQHSTIAVSDTTHVIGEMFNALDALIGGLNVWGSNLAPDAQISGLTNPANHIWPDIVNMSMPPKMSLLPMNPTEKVDGLPRIEPLSERGGRQSTETIQAPEGTTQGQDAISSVVLIQPRTLSEPTDLAGYGGAKPHPLIGIQNLCLHNRTHNSAPNANLVMNSESVSDRSTNNPTDLCNELPPVVKDNQKQPTAKIGTNPEPSCPIVHNEQTQTLGSTTTPYSSLAMLANVMLLTAILQQVSVPVTGTNTVPSRSDLLDHQKCLSESMDCRGSIEETPAVSETPNVISPLLWGGPQSPRVLSTLLGLLTAPSITFPRP